MQFLDLATGALLAAWKCAPTWLGADENAPVKLLLHAGRDQVGVRASLRLPCSFSHLPALSMTFSQ
jgi:hypothetical protein